MPASPENVIELLENRQAIGVFRDREHAGQVLAGMLAAFRGSNALVVGIPAGGLPVAAAIAMKLGLGLDYLVVKKVTPPDNTEFGYGAIAADGSMQLNRDVARRLGLDKAAIEQGITMARDKVNQREKYYAGLLHHKPVRDREIILVDDGLATGVTCLTAIKSLQQQGVNSITGAMPTAHEQSLYEMAGHMGAIYCANVRSGFRYAVAAAYQHWHDVSDQEVAAVLGQFHHQSA